MDATELLLHSLDSKAVLVADVLGCVGASEFLNAQNRLIVVNVVEQGRQTVKRISQCSVVSESPQFTALLEHLISNFLVAEKSLTSSLQVSNFNFFQEHEIVSALLQLTEGIKYSLLQARDILRSALHIPSLQFRRPKFRVNDSFSDLPETSATNEQVCTTQITADALSSSILEREDDTSCTTCERVSSSCEGAPTRITLGNTSSPRYLPLPSKESWHHRCIERYALCGGDCFHKCNSEKDSWDSHVFGLPSASNEREEVVLEKMCDECVNAADSLRALLCTSCKCLERHMSCTAEALEGLFSSLDPIPPFVSQTDLKKILQSFIFEESELKCSARKNINKSASLNIELLQSERNSPQQRKHDGINEGTEHNLRRDVNDKTELKPRRGPCLLESRLDDPNNRLKFCHSPDLHCNIYLELGFTPYKKASALVGLEVIASEADDIERTFERKGAAFVAKLVSRRGPFLLGICGASGIGKTCTAIVITRSKEIREHFLGGIHWVSVGRNPNLLAVQTWLWKEAAGIEAPFHSVAEGTLSFRRFLSNGPPILLVLDDVWEANHIKAFGYCEGQDYSGKIMFTSRLQNLFSGENTECFLVGPLDRKDGASLFCSAAGAGPEMENVAAEIAAATTGNPLVLQALGSAMYGRKDLESWNEMKLWLQTGARAHVTCKAGMGDEDIEQTGRLVREGKQELITEKGYLERERSLAIAELDVCLEEEVLPYVLLPCISCLREIQPALQDCFLDLAAFPKGESVSTKQLQDLWGLDKSTMNRDKVLTILGVFASRSMVQWTVADSGETISGRGSSLRWKLADSFYELASSIAAQVCLEGDRCLKEFGLATKAAFCDTRLGVPFKAAVERKPSEVIGIFGADIKSIGEGTGRLFLPGRNLEHVPASLASGLMAEIATKISLPGNEFKEFSLSKDMPLLRVAIVYNNRKLRRFSSEAFKGMRHIHLLDLHGCSSLTCLPKTVSTLQDLRILDLSDCTSLTCLPSSVDALQNLLQLRLSGCSSLVNVPKSLARLAKLEILHLDGCSKIQTLPSLVGLSSLLVLELSNCSSLQALPPSIGSLGNLQLLNLRGCWNLEYEPSFLEQIKMLTKLEKFSTMAVPPSLWTMPRLEVLHLSSVRNLTYLPRGLGMLQHLTYLSVSGCRSLEWLPEDLGTLQHLQYLDVSYTGLRQLPQSLGDLKYLIHLCLRGCARLHSVPSTVSTLPSVEHLDLSHCWDFFIVPSSLGDFNSLPMLQELDLSGSKIPSLPKLSASALSQLQRLKLCGCMNLTSLPASFGMLQSLKVLDLEGCEKLTSLEGIRLGELKNLWWLNLRNCTSLVSLPGGDLTSLKFLDVSGCSGLNVSLEPLVARAEEGSLKLIRWGALWR